MTRSDIILAISKARDAEDLDKLVKILHKKMEAVYSLVFDLEKNEDPLAQLLAKEIRERLES